MNTHIYKLVSLLVYFTLLISCASNEDIRLKYALELAEGNRPELEKVLDHYSVGGKDNLRYKAARFLIENMPGHYSYAGKEIEQYYKELDSVMIADTSQQYKREIKPIIEEIAARYAGLNRKITEDAKMVTADFIIKNIDLAFDVWENRPYAKHLSFDQFCEYILPYKTTELQQLDNWREIFSRSFAQRWESTPYSDIEKQSVFEAAVCINHDVCLAVKPHGIDSGYSGYPFLNASTMMKMPFGLCSDYCVLGTSVLRSYGIPIVKEYVPLWSREDVGHDWYTLLNANGVHLPFTWGLETNPGDVFFPLKPMPKVYRETFAHNPETLKLLNNAKYKGHGIRPFRIDVTDEYLATTDLSIPIFKTKLSDKYAYISAFNNRSWVIVDYGQIKSGKAHFKNMGRSVVYLIMGYDGNTLVPISDPFLIKSNGEIEYFTADTKQLEEVCLTRKFHMRGYAALSESRMIGGEIQASNDRDFKNHSKLFQIEDLLFPDLIPLNSTHNFRYWRYYGPKGSWGNIAEVQFYEKNSDEMASGSIIGIEGFPNNGKENAFDGDWLTGYDSKVEDGAWVGMDMGKPILIDRVRIIPRSDDNGIHHGDEYELKYWSKDGWKSLGRQIGKERILIFCNAPKGALLWLSNLTRGREERIFVYRDGKQEWW